MLLNKHVYLLPEDEFDILLQAARLMLDQDETFNKLWQLSRSEVPAYYFVDKKEEEKELKRQAKRGGLAAQQEEEET